MSNTSNEVSTQPATSNSGSAVCGKCQASNDSASQFCAGCGHILYEKCSGCDKPVLLTQAFCGNCGQDLAAAVRRQIQQLEQKTASAVTATKSADYETARALLSGVVSKKSDYRFAKVATDAEVAPPQD